MFAIDEFFSLYFEVSRILKINMLTENWQKDYDQSTFSQIHEIGNNGINANFVFSHICSFLHYLHI